MSNHNSPNARIAFADYVRAFMKLNPQYSQNDIGKIVGKSGNAVSTWIKGTSLPTGNILQMKKLLEDHIKPKNPAPAADILSPHVFEVFMKELRRMTAALETIAKNMPPRTVNHATNPGGAAGGSGNTPGGGGGGSGNPATNRIEL